MSAGHSSSSSSSSSNEGLGDDVLLEVAKVALRGAQEWLELAKLQR